MNIIIPIIIVNTISEKSDDHLESGAVQGGGSRMKECNYIDGWVTKQAEKELQQVLSGTRPKFNIFNYVYESYQEDNS